MKKLLSVLLTLALLLGCASGLAEETAEKQILGSIRVNGEFTLKATLPEGYRVVPFEQSDDMMMLRIVSKDNTKPQMALCIAFDETYANVDRLNDLDDEALLILEKTFTDTDPYVDITYDETYLGTRLLLARTTSELYDYLDILTIYKGYFVEFVMRPGEGAAEQALSEEDVEMCISFLTDVDFVDGIETPELKKAGATFTVTIDGYDAAEGTIDVTLLTPVTLTEWQVVSKEVGDTITIGDDEVEIATMTFEGNDAVINEEYYLYWDEETGLYTAYLYEAVLLQAAEKATLTLDENVEFVEGIDPETGDPLDEKKLLTVYDLFVALIAAEEGGVGFTSQTVNITFNDSGVPTRVERFYAPYQ